MGLVAQGSTVGPTVLSLAILNNLVLTMSSQMGNTLAKRRMQKLENLHYYVLGTLFPIPYHHNDQRGEFLESWMAYQEFDEFPDLIEWYTTIGNGTLRLLKEEYTTIKEGTLLKDIEHFLYLTQSYFSDDTPNQILHLMSTLILWSKIFYTTIGHYPTLYDYLDIKREELLFLRLEHLLPPNISVNLKPFRSTLKVPPVYCGEMPHHMRDSIETCMRLPCLSCHRYNMSVCHTPLVTCLSVCQSHQPSVCHTTNLTRPYVCQSRQTSDHCTVDATGPSVCQPHHTSVHQSYTTSDHHTDLTTSQSICQSHQSSVRCTVGPTHPSVCQQQYTPVCHTINMTSLSVCQTQDTSVRHTNITTSLSVCQTQDTSVRHTTSMTSPSVCPSNQSSDRHTTSMTSPSVCPSKQSSDRHTTSNASPSVCQSFIPSVNHTVMSTSPSVCQLHDLSVIIPPVCRTVCPSSVTSVLPSANPTVKLPTSIPVQNFLHEQNPGKLPFIHTSTESSVHHPDSPSINSSLSAANPSKIPCSDGEISMVNYLHKRPVTSHRSHD